MPIATRRKVKTTRRLVFRVTRISDNAAGRHVTPGRRTEREKGRPPLVYIWIAIKEARFYKRATHSCWLLWMRAKKDIYRHLISHQTYELPLRRSARLCDFECYAAKYAKFEQLMKMSRKIHRLDVDNKYEITVRVRY